MKTRVLLTDHQFFQLMDTNYPEINKIFKSNFAFNILSDYNDPENNQRSILWKIIFPSLNLTKNLSDYKPKRITISKSNGSNAFKLELSVETAPYKKSAFSTIRNINLTIRLRPTHKDYLKLASL